MVTDHALVRWLERRHGIDMEFFRQLFEKEVREAIEAGAVYLHTPNLTYVFEDRRCITVLGPDMRPKKRGKDHKRWKQEVRLAAKVEAEFEREEAF